MKQTKWVECLKLNDVVREPASGSVCMVAGWGRTKKKAKPTSDVLTSGNVTVINRTICNSKKYYNRSPYITKNMICAGSKGKNKADTCQVSGPKNHLKCCFYPKMLITFVLCAGRFGRSNTVQWISSWSYIFWKEVWNQTQTGSVCFPYQRSPEVDQGDNKNSPKMTNTDFKFCCFMLSTAVLLSSSCNTICFLLLKKVYADNKTNKINLKL